VRFKVREAAMSHRRAALRGEDTAAAMGILSSGLRAKIFFFVVVKFE
jgi:hypothetical protein